MWGSGGQEKEDKQDRIVRTASGKELQLMVEVFAIVRKIASEDQSVSCEPMIN